MEHNLKTPLDEESLKKLKVSDKVYLSGTIVTARDRAHVELINSNVELGTDVIYHCGPIIKNNEVLSAGPTTSARMEKYTVEVIKKYGIKAIIGKGGLDIHDSMVELGCVYLAAVGGAGVLLNEYIDKVKDVKFREFGMPEAMWVFEVTNMPLVVAMDLNGGNLYKDVKEYSRKVLE